MAAFSSTKGNEKVSLSVSNIEFPFISLKSPYIQNEHVCYKGEKIFIQLLKCVMEICVVGAAFVAVSLHRLTDDNEGCAG